jgi:hypothetical protein
MIPVPNSVSRIKLLNRDVYLIALKSLLEIREHAFGTNMLNFSRTSITLILDGIILNTNKLSSTEDNRIMGDGLSRS